MEIILKFEDDTEARNVANELKEISDALPDRKNIELLDDLRYFVDTHLALHNS